MILAKPHSDSLASLFVHIVASGWSAWQIAHTSRVRADFDRLMLNGACGVDFIGSYWKSRSLAELPSMAFNIAALLVSIILTWRLVKVCILHFVATARY